MGKLERKPGGPDNWLEKVGGLDPYLEKIAAAIHERRGKSISNSIQIAWGMIRKWAAGGGDVNADTRAKAAKAVANMEAKRARARSMSLSSGLHSRVDVAELIDLTAPATDEELDGFVLDLAASLEDDVLDLAPGDYRPPYDWKHGYIPLTPAAALSKAKKAPYAGKGGKRGKGAAKKAAAAAATPIVNRKPAGTKSVSKASMDELTTMTRELPAGKTRDAVDAELRRRGVSPATVREGAAAKAARERVAKARDDERFGPGSSARGSGGSTHAEHMEARKAQLERLRKARDDEQRGRGVPGELKRAQNAVNASGSRVDKSSQTGQDGAMNPTETRFNKGDKAIHPTMGEVRVLAVQQHEDGYQVARVQDARIPSNRGGVWTATRDLKTPGADTSSEAKRNPGPRRITAAERRKWDADRDAGLRATADMSLPQLRAQNDKLVREGRAMKSTDAELLEHQRQIRKEIGWTDGDADPDLLMDRRAQRDRAAAEQKAQESAAGKPRKQLPGGGSYPVKSDGSPDYGAMSAEQAATIRAKEQGRGVGARVATDRGPGTVKSVSSRGTTIDPDQGDAFHVAAGTPGHGRIRPLSAEEGPEGPDARMDALADRNRAADAEKVKPGTPVVGQNPGGLATKNGVFVGYDENGWHRISHELGTGRRVTGTFNPAHTKTRDGKSLAEKPTGDATKPQTREQLKAGAERSANPQVLSRFPDGQRVDYAGGGGKGSGVVVGRRTDSQGTILAVKDDKDGKTYEWAPEHVRPQGTAAEKRGLTPDAYGKVPAQPSPIKSRFGTADADPAGAPRAGSSSTNPDAPIRIEHGPDGTLVKGTSREDAAAIKEVGGFKWSRNLGAWYLPRTWGENTRERRVRQLEAKLGDKAGVDRKTGPKRSAAERDAETRERAAARAERMDSRAEKRTAEAQRRFEASDLREEKSGIPFGQPILVGHHSERKHRRTIERAHANLGKGVEAQRDAERAQEAAERARRTASGAESKVTTGNRIKKLEAEQRDIERKLNGSSSQMRGPATGSYAERLRTRAAEVADELEFNRGKLEAAGGVPSKDTVSPGDFVKISGTWYPVQKSNAKSATVPSPMGTGNRTAPWHKVQEHRKAGDVSREDVARMVREVERPFPSLADALRKAAPAKRDGDTPGASVAQARDRGVSAGAAETPGGITEANVRRMSDDQLERAMSRLMAANDYDGPAFGIIERELNRRDAEGNRRRR